MNLFTNCRGWRLVFMIQGTCPPPPPHSVSIPGAPSIFSSSKMVSTTMAHITYILCTINCQQITFLIPILTISEPTFCACRGCSRSPPLSFLFNVCVLALHTFGSPPPQGLQQRTQSHEVLVSHFVHACCLLACGCLLLLVAASARKGISTLGLIEGDKTSLVPPAR